MRHVFANPILARVIDADDNHRRHRTFADQTIRRLVHLPLNTCVRSCRLKQILPIVQVKHRIMPARILCVVIIRRQPHPQETRVPEDAAAKFMQTQVSGRPAGANRRGRRRAIPYFLDSSHRKNIRLDHHPSLESEEARTFTTPASTAIAAISPSELKHRMHQVSEHIALDVGEIQRKCQSRECRSQ